MFLPPPPFPPTTPSAFPPLPPIAIAACYSILLLIICRSGYFCTVKLPSSGPCVATREKKENSVRVKVGGIFHTLFVTYICIYHIHVFIYVYIYLFIHLFTYTFISLLLTGRLFDRAQLPILIPGLYNDTLVRDHPLT